MSRNRIAVPLPAQIRCNQIFDTLQQHSALTYLDFQKESTKDLATVQQLQQQSTQVYMYIIQGNNATGAACLGCNRFVDWLTHKQVSAVKACVLHVNLGAAL